MSYGKIMMAIETKDVKVITESMNNLLKKNEYDLFNEAHEVLDKCGFYISFVEIEKDLVQVQELRHVARP